MIDFNNFILNEQQLQAVISCDGPLLILAGAGSGKTRVITYRIAYMIGELNINPRNILAITFTNKAASEMKERVEKLLPMEASSVWISTFHYLCVRILRSNITHLGYNSNFIIYDSDDQKSLVNKLIKELNLDNRTFKAKSIVSKISSYKNKMLYPNDILATAVSYNDKQIAKVYTEYEKQLKKSNALDFDDLLLKTIELFQTNKKVLETYQERFKYIMVDEYQDTNPIQFILIQLLSQKYKNICVVGDDDQSIYKFRGADIRNILDFEKHFKKTKQIKLEENYRSTSQILNVANSFIKNNVDRKPKSMITTRADGEKVVFARKVNAYAEADYIIDEIKKSNANLSDIAILYRSNYLSRIIEERLVSNGFYYKIVGGVNFYARKEIKDIIAYLRVVAGSPDEISIRRIINTPKRGIGDTTIRNISEYARVNEITFYDVLENISSIDSFKRSSERINEFLQMINRLREFANENSISDLISEIIKETNYKDYLLEEGELQASTRYDNIMELVNKAAEFEGDLSEFLEELSLIQDLDNLNNNDEYITLMTIHAAKGLEYKYVFVIGLEDGVFPSCYNLESDNQEEIEEERRVFYVAVTRAIDKLYLTSSEQRMKNGNLQFNDISRFISEIPEEYLDVIEDEDGNSPLKFSNNNYSYKNGSSNYRQNTFNRSQYSKEEFTYSGIKRNKTSYTDKKINLDVLKGMPKVDLEKGLDYKVGDRVSHVKFGTGVVTEIVKGNKDYTVSVEFDNGESRTLLAAFAKLEKISD